MAQIREKKNITCKEVVEIDNKLDEFVRQMTVYEQNYTLEGLDDKELCGHIHALESKFDTAIRTLRKVEQLTTRHVLSRATRGRDTKRDIDSGVGSVTSTVLQPDETSDTDEEPMSPRYKDVDQSPDTSKGLCSPMKSLSVETTIDETHRSSSSLVQDEAFRERETDDGTQATASPEQNVNFLNIHDAAQTPSKQVYEKPKVNFPEENLESHDDNTLVDSVDSSTSQRDASAASSSRRPSLSSNPMYRQSADPRFLD